MSTWNDDKQLILNRLRRAEGQLRAIQSMIEDEQDCEKVVQQFAAVRKAMDRAFFDLMACVTKRELDSVGALSAKASASLGKVTALLTRYG
ncbi:MAG: metal-sensing transcriptional repressor [Pseudomonadota bacterium]|nr:metal-sensing transcriptional repressor [Pseudomonadota bacterium]